MKYASIRTAFLLCLASGIRALAQTNGYIVPEYLAAQYTAPDNAPASVVIAGQDEPGSRIVVTGRTLLGEQAVPGVSLYVFHTDANGRYSTTIDDPRAAELNPRLHGILRTDKDGRYRFETSRPGSYDNQPEHVHYVVKADGYEPLLLVLQFADDALIRKAPQLAQPMADSWAFENGPCKARVDCVVTRPVVRDDKGVSHVTRDIQMVKATK